MSQSNGKPTRIGPPLHHAGDLVNAIIAAEQTMDYHHGRLQEARAEYTRLVEMLQTLMRSDPDRILVHPPRAYVLSNGVLTRSGVAYANDVPLEPGADPVPSDNHPVLDRGAAGLLTAAHDDGGP